MKFSLKKHDLIKIVITIALSGLIIGSSFLMQGMGSSSYSSNQERRWQNPITLYGYFHTDLQVQFYATESELTELSSLVYTMYTKYDSLFDRYYARNNSSGIPVSNLYVVNNRYGEGPTVIDQELFQLLQEAMEYTVITEGKFHLAIGALSDLWAPYMSELEVEGSNNLHNPIPSEHTEPSASEIASALACTPNYQEINQYIVLDESNHTVELKTYPGCDGNVTISVGAIAKGFATKKVAQAIAEAGYLAVINSGSSSIEFVTTTDIEKSILLLNPLNYDNSNSEIPHFSMKLQTFENVSFSTSGDYESGYLIELEDSTLVRRHHILSSNTGYSNNYSRSVSVMTDDSTLADVMSTALMNATLEEGILLIQYFEEQGHEVDAIWQIETTDSLLIKTTNFDLTRYSETNIEYPIERIQLGE